MKFLSTIVLAAAWTLAYTASEKSAKALYFLDSDPQGASVVSFKIGGNSSLGEPKRISTGGKGLVGTNMNGSVQTDPLFSQSSVIVDGNRLFTVNAGSNTLAAFHIPHDDPTNLVLVGKPVDTMGDVPNSVAYSHKNKIACVANTGPRAGVQCFSVSDCRGMKALGNLKPLPVPNQTNPPMGAANTVSNILFNPSETAVFVIIKGDGTEDGFLYAYKVHNGTVSEKAVKSRPENLPIPFGMSFVSDQSAVIATPNYGAAFVTINDDLSVTIDTPLNITNQSATCWTAASPETGSVYLLDAGVPDITFLAPETRDIGRILPGYEDGMGNFDGIVGGSKLYVLQRAPAVAVFDLHDPSCGPEVVDLDGFGNRAFWIVSRSQSHGFFRLSQQPSPTPTDRLGSYLITQSAKSPELIINLAYFKHLPRRLNESPALANCLAVLCDSWTNFQRSIAPDRLIEPRLYGRALRSLHTALNGPKQLNVETLTAMTLLQRVEVLFDTRRGDHQTVHSGGMIPLMIKKGPPNLDDPLDIHLAHEVQDTLATHWLVHRGDNFLVQSPWVEHLRKAFERLIVDDDDGGLKIRTPFTVEIAFGKWPEYVHQMGDIKDNSDYSAARRQAADLQSHLSCLFDEVCESVRPLLATALREGIIREAQCSMSPKGLAYEFTTFKAFDMLLSYYTICIILKLMTYSLSVFQGCPNNTVWDEFRHYCSEMPKLVTYLRRQGKVACMLFVSSFCLPFEGA
ncbi:hypothetical protein NW762_010772 [Fusarium torreyae]|uniref:Uncharacterized protein n=1 Tax=Fusarium torreyae TaxID=1237075 RepID=A0A9W8RQX8_9HYPO|nr:hypothetical protein NW762_010772 [Fusarium torreyae]